MDVFGMLKGMSYKYIFFLIAAAGLFKFVLGLNFKILVSFFDIRLPFREWLGLTCIAAMTNYLLPAKAGMAAQAVYLKKNFGFRYTNFLSSVTGFYAVTFLVNAVIGTLLSIKLLNDHMSSGEFVFMFFLFISFVTAFLIFAIFHFPKLSSRVGIFRDFFEGFRYFHNKPQKISGLIISQVVVVLAIGLRLWVAFRALGIDISLTSSIIVALITSFAIFINLTPGGLGVKEFLLTFSASILGVSPPEAVMVAMLDRVIDVLVSFTLGYSFALYLHIGNVYPKNEEVRI